MTKCTDSERIVNPPEVKIIGAGLRNWRKSSSDRLMNLSATGELMMAKGVTGLISPSGVYWRSVAPRRA